MNRAQKILITVGSLVAALAVSPLMPEVALPFGLTLAKVLAALGAFTGGVGVRTPGHVRDDNIGDP